MIPKGDIARIKITQKDAGLDDKTYRKVLEESSGVSSCTKLEPYQVPDVIKAIKALGENRDGWKNRQLSKFRQYAKFAGMTPTESRIFLSNTVNIVTNEESPFLAQGHFDVVMAELEAELELRVTQGNVAKPAKIKMTYWRDRRPHAGESNTRVTHHVWTVWFDLQPWLDEDKRKNSYLFSIASKCCHKRVESMSDLSANDTWHVIEALKLRIKQEQKKMQREVPF